jgi:hypothetical protein
MIPPTGVRVWLATGHTDMRNYVECRIMRSPQRQSLANCGVSVAITRHNLPIGRSTSASPGACRGRGNDPA